MRRAVVILAALIGAAACEDNAAPESATLSGVLRLQDTWGTPLSSHDGVSVNVVGSSRKAVTDANGKWRLTGVPFGEPDIEFHKDGFGAFLLHAVPISEEKVQIVDTTFLAQRPASTLILDKVTVSSEFGEEAFVIDAHLSAAPPANAKWTSGIIFVGTSSNVSPEITAHQTWHAALSFGSQTELKFVIFISGYRGLFTKGQTLFVRGYAYSAFCSCYEDPASGLTVFTNTGPSSNSLSFVMQ